MSPPTATPAGRATAPQVDPRGQRVAAGLTVVTLAAALLALGSTVGAVLLGWQTVVFAAGALLGPARTPYGWLFRTLVRPRLGPPRHTEDAAPPRFAQAVGLGFTLVALVLLAVGSAPAAAVPAGLALGAAFLNAAFGLCLGCEIYLRVVQLRAAVLARRRTHPATPPAQSTPLPEV